MTKLYPSSNQKFSYLFFKHVEKFSKTHNLYSEDSEILVALSGGEDSSALLFYFYSQLQQNKIKGLRAIHINHGTRASQEDEEKIVRLYCESLKIPLQVIKLDGLLGEKNFEEKARLLRYKVFEEKRKDSEIIALGHHLNDSFEWTLMQSFKSSDLKSSLGIPVKRKFFIRPFLCVSKKQITYFRRNFDLPFVKDPTNLILDFERNYIRNKIVPLIESRYPKYLKHYARRQQVLLTKLKLTKVKIFKDEEGFFFKTKGLDSQEILEVVKVELKKRSNVRWRAGKQEDQIANMVKKFKKGPMFLPGGKFLFVYKTYLGVFDKKDIEFSDKIKNSAVG